MLFVLKCKCHAEAVQRYQEGLEEQLEEAKQAAIE